MNRLELTSLAALALGAAAVTLGSASDARGPALQALTSTAPAGAQAPAPDVGPAAPILKTGAVELHRRGGSGRGSDDRGWRDAWGGRETCRAYDDGWEEHWGGHGDCSSCLRKHPRCNFRCTVEAYRCTAEWVPDGGGYGESFRGERRSSEWEARESAKRECMDANWRRRDGGYCRVRDCDSEEETSRTGGC